ncbi:MAG TPA: YIP1 family protein [Edaphobacter sp.]|nr:YIP1 family protein [Edaphobacter sp.]
MTEETLTSSQGAGLSEVERVVDVFVAPSKTFTDILRNASWWLPFALILIMMLGSTITIDKTVGFARVAEVQIQQNPKQADRFNNLTAEQKATQLQGMEKGYRFSSYGSFLIVLIFVAIAALLYWATFNFGLGAQTTYKQMFAVWMYASLPRLITGVLSIVLLLAGVNTDSYNMQNPIGTNLAYYMQDSAPWLKTVLGFFDVIGLWVLALLVIGTAIVAKVPRAKAAVVVIGWWLFGMIVLAGISVATS